MSKDNSENLAELNLVKASANGSKEAYRQLVEKYQKRIFALAFDILRNQQDAEDVVQESFVKAYFALKDFQFNSSFYTWIYRIAHNMAIDYRRKIQRKQRNEVSTVVKTEGSSETANIESQFPAPAQQQPDQQAEIRQDYDILQKAFAALPSEQREIIRLRELEGCSYQQISGILKLAPGTVMSRLFYARKKLQEIIKVIEAGGEYSPDKSNSGPVALSENIEFNGSIVS